MKINALVPWFGSNRQLREQVGKQLGRLAWCGVACVGSGCELPGISTRAGVANDLHRNLINLFRTVGDPAAFEVFRGLVDGMLFHPDELARAQRIARDWADQFDEGAMLYRADNTPNVSNTEAAAAYFAASWMGRSSLPGTNGELRSGLAMRWTASGGGSATRYRSAVESLQAWHEALKRWEFQCMDAHAFIDKALTAGEGKKDMPGDRGIYLDYPWPDDGDCYVHTISERQHRETAKMLSAAEKTRVVVRYGDHPLIREIYPEDRWTWIRNESRDQANQGVEEVLIVNGPAY